MDHQFFGSLQGGDASQGFTWDPSNLYNMVAGHAPAPQEAVYEGHAPAPQQAVYDVEEEVFPTARQANAPRGS